MWERPSPEEPAGTEIQMYVLSVDAPASGEQAAGLDGDGVVGSGHVEAILLPRQGTGTWPNGERAVRLGNAEEILITLPTNPFEAMAAARSGAVFDEAVRGLRVNASTRRDGECEVSWEGQLRAPVRWRSVSLRLYASPSLNVTVLTIVPVKARKISSRSFVRIGLRTARQLGRRIEAELQLADAPAVMP